MIRLSPHFSPAIPAQLVRLADELDDGERSIASIWRELGYRARRADRFQPSYESVRRLVTGQRVRRRLEHLLKRAALRTIEALWRSRSPTTTLLHLLSAAGVENRPDAGAGPARAGPPRATPRESA